MRLVNVGGSVWIDPKIIVSVCPTTKYGASARSLITTATHSKEEEYFSPFTPEQVIEALHDNEPYEEN